MAREGRLGPGAVGALRTFSYWLAAGTAGLTLLEGIDYWDSMREEPTLMETAVAIFGNLLVIDEDGRASNARQAEHRAAQYIHQYMTGIPATPPFESWEVELHAAFGGQPKA